MGPSPLIYQYLKKYKEDPTSRVFAPLSEAYRKSGLVAEAIEIARDGLRYHPHFTGGRVALARALFEAKKFEEVVAELSALVLDVPDNLAAQRLLAESHLMLGHTVDALSAYKMLLYFRPEDEEISQIVKELEEQTYGDGALLLNRESADGQNPDFSIKTAQDAMAQDPQWKREQWMKRVQLLQSMLQNIERYKWHYESSGSKDQGIQLTRLT